MIRQIYAVKDNAVQAYGNPIFVRARGEAVRSFMDECKNKQSPMNQHPADYDLYFLGTYNEETGELTQPNPENVPERVARAVDYQVNQE